MLARIHLGTVGVKSRRPTRHPLRVTVTSIAEGREVNAEVAHGEAVQVPGAATRDLLGLGSEKPGELPLESQPRVLLDDALADCIGYLVAAEAEHIDTAGAGQVSGIPEWSARRRCVRSICGG